MFVRFVGSVVLVRFVGFKYWVCCMGLLCLFGLLTSVVLLGFYSFVFVGFVDFC